MRIEINDITNKIGTGFFLKVNINNTLLITCNHILSSDLINLKKEIIIYFGKKTKEKNRNNILDKNKRFIKSFEEPIDVTLIEIIDKDNIPEEKFLYSDFNYKNG